MYTQKWMTHVGLLGLTVMLATSLANASEYDDASKPPGPKTLQGVGPDAIHHHATTQRLPIASGKSSAMTDNSAAWLQKILNNSNQIQFNYEQKKHTVLVWPALIQHFVNAYPISSLQEEPIKSYRAEQNNRNFGIFSYIFLRGNKKLADVQIIPKGSITYLVLRKPSEPQKQFTGVISEGQNSTIPEFEDKLVKVLQAPSLEYELSQASSISYMLNNAPGSRPTLQTVKLTPNLRDRMSFVFKTQKPLEQNDNGPVTIMARSTKNPPFTILEYTLYQKSLFSTKKIGVLSVSEHANGLKIFYTRSLASPTGKPGSWQGTLQASSLIPFETSIKNQPKGILSRIVAPK